MNKKNEKRIVERLKEYSDIEVPYHVWVCFGEQTKTIKLSGDQVSLGEDYKSLSEARVAIQWLANQLGGNVNWEKEKNEKK